MVDIAKAGWLFKQSSFLKRWKKHWFSLSVDGYLRQFDSPNDYIANKTLHVPRDVIQIIVGTNADTKAPDGFSMEFLLKLVTREGSWTMCAENIDDMLAWQMALEQARVMHQQMRRPNQPIPAYLEEVVAGTPEGMYPMYYRGNYRGTYPSRIVHTPQGPITVVYVDAPYYRRYSGGDVALGALAGTALASSLFFPFWFPLFWC